jgi:endogenous inhibitor of DNA gyrase (YacG/DUF329 family)
MTALTCPGCGNAMQSLELERQAAGAVQIDLCGSCQALWLDAHESMQLSPVGTIALFRAIHEATPAVRAPLPAHIPCPRCATSLEVTQDLTIHGRFTYFRCAFGHGRFTPFVQFLREKNFLREPPPAELERLKSIVRIIRCASCGAPVDLAHDTVCPYCRAPITILDPESVARTLRELDAAAAQRARIANPDAAAAALASAQFEHALTEQHVQDAAGVGVDLVALGLVALGAALFR